MGDEHLLLPVYRYEVDLGDNREIGFKSVSGLKISAAYEPLEVGGINNGPVLLRMPVKDTGRITLERGKYLSKSANAFTYLPGKMLGESMIIKVKNDDNKVGATYSVRNPVIESIELPTLDAMDSSVFIEKLTIAHRGITEEI